MSDDETSLRSIHLSDDDRPRHRRRRGRRAVAVLLTLLLVLVLGVAGGAWYLNHRISENIQTLPGGDPFADIPATSRPTKATTGTASKAVNILLAGSDARNSGQTTGEGRGDAWERTGQRTDSIMIVHISGDRESATVMSIPRDSWVEIPGYGMNKINAAYSFGGPTLFVRTVEKLTDVHIDHLAFIDWDGFTSLTDALGGVDIDLASAVQGFSGRTYGPGLTHFDGQSALDFVRERHSVPGGDFGRQKRQQAFLRAVMQKAMSGDTLHNPVKLIKMLNAISENLSVDENFSTKEMRGLASSATGMRSGDVTFMSVPNAGTAMKGSQSVVLLDKEKCDELWKAVADDDIAKYLDIYGADTLAKQVY